MADLVPVGVPVVDEVIETVIKRLHSDRSRKEYPQDVKIFAAFLSESGLIQATDITYADMVAYQDYLSLNKKGRKRSPLGLDIYRNSCVRSVRMRWPKV